jgi:hypothetical protein
MKRELITLLGLSTAVFTAGITRESDCIGPTKNYDNVITCPSKDGQVIYTRDGAEIQTNHDEIYITNTHNQVIYGYTREHRDWGNPEFFMVDYGEDT